MFPKVGSLGGRTDITITGDFFDSSAQVTIAGNYVKMDENGTVLNAIGVYISNDPRV